MAKQANKRNAGAFNRMFHPEFLAVRKDVTRLMLACAEGNAEEVEAALKQDPHSLHHQNKDGNSLLLLTVANSHVRIADHLLTLKADPMHKNQYGMDSVDYSTMDGVKNRLSKVVLSHCDYVIPQIVAVGQAARECEQVVVDLKQQGSVCIFSKTLGKLPDFSDIFAKETEYGREWKQALNWVCNTVRKGMLLLSEDMDYLVHDALMSGALEVNQERRWVYVRGLERVIKFGAALKKIYAGQMAVRMLEAAWNGDSTAVQGLLKAKAHPNIEDVRGQTVLMKASHNGDPVVVRCLLMAKANANAINKDGYAPLMLAAVRNNEKAVSLLIKGKADLTMKTNRGYSVLEFVKHAGYDRMVSFIFTELENEKKSKKDAAVTLEDLQLDGS